MRRSFLILTLSSLLLYACGDGLEQKEETDALGYRVEYRQDPATGLRQGVAREYAPDGSLTIEENYLDGELQGQRKLYAPNGQVVVEENYEKGIFKGQYVNYDSLGNVTLRGQYIDGEMSGPWFSYYADNSVKEVVTFNQNAENGPFREWYANGNPKASGAYLNGDNEHGTLHMFAENGELERVMVCNAGRCNTTWTPDSTFAAPAGSDMTQPR